VQGAGCGVEGLELRVQDAGCGVEGLEFWVQGAGCGVEGWEFRDQGGEAAEIRDNNPLLNLENKI